jgi:hypothetical protein
LPGETTENSCYDNWIYWERGHDKPTDPCHMLFTKIREAVGGLLKFGLLEFGNIGVEVLFTWLGTQQI